jgi:hypothetical protein
MHREEELTAARMAYQQRHVRTGPTPGDVTPAPSEKPDGPVEPASPSPSPQPKRRSIVFADPVTFRYTSSSTEQLDRLLRLSVSDISKTILALR